MGENLPEEQENIRQHLISVWIAEQPTVEDQINGATAIASAFCGILNEIIGELGTRAVFNRAYRSATRNHPVLASFGVTEGCLIEISLETVAQGINLETSRDALIELVNQVFAVLNEFLGDAITPFLRDVEAVLASRQS